MIDIFILIAQIRNLVHGGEFQVTKAIAVGSTSLFPEVMTINS